MIDSPRAQLGQLSWFARENRRPERWRRTARVRRGMHLPSLPRRRSDPREVWAVAMARDEQDVVRCVVEHLLDQGVDRVLVVDNLSQDETPGVLADLATRHAGRVLVGADREPRFYQQEKLSHLARRAWAAGAGWVVPFDADELWFAETGSLAEHLRSSAAHVLYADMFHMVPTVASPADLRSAEFVLDATPSLPGKVAMRAHPLLTLRPGNHDVLRVGERRGGLRIAHAIYRGPEQLARKLRQGSTAMASRHEPDDEIGPHWQAGARIEDTEAAEVWARISAGLPDRRIWFEANGPMVRVRPATWTTWDPDGAVGHRPGRYLDTGDR